MSSASRVVLGSRIAPTVFCLSRVGSNAMLLRSSRCFTTATTQATNQKGWLTKLWDQYSIGGQQKRIIMGERLFRAAERRASDPIWYGPGRIERSFRARHAVLTMHVWFLHKRLVSDKVDPHFSLLIQEELFDILWNDTMARIRAEGVNELTVNKHLKDVQELTFLHLTHYDHAYTEYATQPEKRVEELMGLVWMHILLKDEELALDDLMKRLVFYIEAQYRNIVHELPHEYFREGRIAWVDIPDFSGMRDNEGKRLGDAPVHPDDVLPEGWFSALTNSGKTYYWQPDTMVAQYKRPG